MPRYGAVWYPGPSADALLNLDAGNLAAVTASLPGVPVTYNHLGIFDAVAQRKSFAELGKVTPVQGPIGRVVGGFVDKAGVGRCVFEVDGPMVSALMAEKMVPAVSLSHATTAAGTLAALEVTLTQDPARSGAVVETALTCDDPVSEYIAFASSKGTRAPPAMEVDAAVPAEAPAATPCEAAIATLSDEHREVRGARAE
jgi:hypothetical protein